MSHRRWLAVEPPGFAKPFAVVATDDQQCLLEDAALPEPLEHGPEDGIGLSDTPLVQRLEAGELPGRVCATVHVELPADRQLRLQLVGLWVAPPVVLGGRVVGPVGVHEIQAGCPPVPAVDPRTELVGVVEPVGPVRVLPRAVRCRCRLRDGNDGVERLGEPDPVGGDKPVLGEQSGVVSGPGQVIPHCVTRLQPVVNGDTVCLGLEPGKQRDVCG
ncbi:MAG: hypothetical protein ACI9CA_000838 [Natronomonas sp.]